MNAARWSAVDLELGDRVAITYAGSTPARARVTGFDERRPHLVKVTYEHSRTAAWVARKRILSRQRSIATGDPAGGTRPARPR